MIADRSARTRALTIFDVPLTTSLTPTIQEHLLNKLRLSIGEAARISGVSVRQLSYWTQKGLVRALGTPSKKRYDFRALERIALIKRFLNDGHPLEEAAREADRMVRASQTRAPDEPQQVIAQRVAELEELIGYLKRRLAQGVPHAQLVATASRLSQLNLAAVLDDRTASTRKRVTAARMSSIR
jgi:DNA-binding transcriptional MerR regulator